MGSTGAQHFQILNNGSISTGITGSIISPNDALLMDQGPSYSDTGSGGIELTTPPSGSPGSLSNTGSILSLDEDSGLSVSSSNSSAISSNNNNNDPFSSLFFTDSQIPVIILPAPAAVASGGSVGGSQYNSNSNNNNNKTSGTTGATSASPMRPAFPVHYATLFKNSSSSSPLPTSMSLSSSSEPLGAAGSEQKPRWIDYRSRPSPAFPPRVPGQLQGIPSGFRNPPSSTPIVPSIASPINSLLASSPASSSSPSSSSSSHLNPFTSSNPHVNPQLVHGFGPSSTNPVGFAGSVPPAPASFPASNANQDRKRPAMPNITRVEREYHYPCPSCSREIQIIYLFPLILSSVWMMKHVCNVFHSSQYTRTTTQTSLPNVPMIT